MSISNFVKKFLLFLWLPLMTFTAVAQNVNLTGISPKTGQANVSNIYITGSGFPGGTIAPANITITLTPVGGGSTVTTTAITVTTVSGTIRRVMFQLSNVVASPTQYQVSIADSIDGFSSTNSVLFTENPPAQITSLAPNSGTQNTSVPVTITGQYTNFIQGITTASFPAGSGITVTNFTVTDNSHASATLVISSGATATTDTMTVATGAQQETATFTVNVPVQNFSVSGNISQLSGSALAGATVTLTPGGQTATTDVNGNYSFASVPSGSYTAAPSFTFPAGSDPADSAVFYPGSMSINVNSNLTGENFKSQLGFTVSGQITYSGTGAVGNQPGQAYLRLVNPTCSTCSFGTSTNGILLNGTTTNPASFVIHGVNPGTYNLDAYFDRAGYGARNLSVQSASGTVIVSGGDVNQGTVTLGDSATLGNVSAAPAITVSKIGQGVIIYYQPITVNGVEQALAYNLAWSFTSPADCNSGSPTNGGGLTVGKHDQLWEDTGKMVILDGSNLNGLFYKSSSPNKPLLGKQVFFCMQGVNAAGTTGAWATTPSITLTALPSSNLVNQSTVTLGVTLPKAPSGPVYAGCYDKTNHNFFVFNDVPHSGYPTTKTYTINGVTNGAQCTPFAGADMDNDGLFTSANPYAGTAFSQKGDIYNLGRNNAAATTISTATSLSTDLTPYITNTNSTLVTTSTGSWLDQNSVLQPQSFGLNFDVLPAVQLPVEVQLQTPSPNVNSLADFAKCLTCGTQGEFNMNLTTSTVAPNVGDSYSLLVTDEKTTVPDNPTLTVSGVNTAFASALSASGGATPTFSWGDPLNPANYTYQFLLTDTSGNVIWKIPAQSGTGFSSAITSITWPNDPTGASNPPSGTLTSGTKYVWSITTIDSNGNTATQKQVYTF